MVVTLPGREFPVIRGPDRLQADGRRPSGAQRPRTCRFRGTTAVSRTGLGSETEDFLPEAAPPSTVGFSHSFVSPGKCGLRTFPGKRQRSGPFETRCNGPGRRPRSAAALPARRRPQNGIPPPLAAGRPANPAPHFFCAPGYPSWARSPAPIPPRAVHRSCLRRPGQPGLSTRRRRLNGDHPDRFHRVDHGAQVGFP